MHVLVDVLTAVTAYVRTTKTLGTQQEGWLDAACVRLVVRNSVFREHTWFDGFICPHALSLGNIYTWYIYLRPPVFRLVPFACLFCLCLSCEYAWHAWCFFSVYPPPPSPGLEYRGRNELAAAPRDGQDVFHSTRYHAPQRFSRQVSISYGKNRHRVCVCVSRARARTASCEFWRRFALFFSVCKTYPGAPSAGVGATQKAFFLFQKNRFRERFTVLL